MTRTEVTDLILAAKHKKGLKWTDIAKKVGQSKEWTTAALLGQMTLDKKQAATVGKLLGLPADAVDQLQMVPYKGSLPSAVPTDPLIYRFYELIMVYGITIKSLIHEEFGDGIMSAIDFSMDISRVPDPKGDRVKIVLNGKFLPYKMYRFPSCAAARPRIHPAAAVSRRRDSLARNRTLLRPAGRAARRFPRPPR